VHDWDSVIAQPETSIVGLAAAVWAATGGTGGSFYSGRWAAFAPRLRGRRSTQDVTLCGNPNGLGVVKTPLSQSTPGSACRD
jgi:hypothetical protein